MKRAERTKAGKTREVKAIGTHRITAVRRMLTLLLKKDTRRVRRGEARMWMRNGEYGGKKRMVV